MSAPRDAFTFEKPCLYWETVLGVYGEQDMGISPGGAQDAFSLRAGNILLGNPGNTSGFEIIFVSEIRVGKNLFIVFTGAEYRSITLLRGDHSFSIRTGEVFMVNTGDRIILGETTRGLRTYLCHREADDGVFLTPRKIDLAGVISKWADSEGRIRVLAGPEYSMLPNPQVFVDSIWKTTDHMDRMGIRLSGGIDPGCRVANMITQPVCDGTIQLTPQGPIILMRHRQTTGGYPRIFNVISADIDLLAQYPPNKFLRFRLVDIEEARRIHILKEETLAEIGS